MKILERAELHKAEAVTTTCKTCGSKIMFFLGVGDPRVGRAKFNCDSYKEWCSYSCPVCDSIGCAEWRSPYFSNEVNATKESVVLTVEDLKEIEAFEPDEKLAEKLENSFWKI
jgi:hypothetical protein